MRYFIGLDLAAKEKLSLESWRDKSLPSFISAAGGRQQGVARPVPAANFHLTLCFLGALREPQLEQLISACGELSATSFAFTLDTTEFWAGPNILVATGEQVPAELIALAQQVESVARKVGLAIEKRAFRPHVTLVRKASNVLAVPLFAPQVACHFSQFHLFESVSGKNGVHYPIRHTWPLHTGKRLREQMQSGLF